MWEKNLTQRLVLIGVVLVLAAWLLYPPKDRLRPGLDIAGGVELVFEIQEEEGERYPNLAEDMKRLLQKRVDPDGVFDLRWRVQGRNRIGVTMPLPPKDAAKLREEFVDAREALFAGANLRRSALEQALRETPENRERELKELADGSAERERLLQEAAQWRDGYVAALKAQQAGPPATQPATVPTTEPTPAPTTEPTSAPASAPTASAPTTEPAEVVTQEDLDLRALDAEDLWRDAVEAVLEKNIDPLPFQETLELDTKSPIRQTALEDLRKQYPRLQDQIGVVVAAFDNWRNKRGFLDGPADLRRLLKGAGVLEFRILAEPSAENITKYDQYRDELHEHGPRPPRPQEAEGWFLIDNPLAFFNLDSQAQLKERAKDPKTSFSAMVADSYRGQWYVLAKLGQQDGLLASNPRRWQLKRAYSDRDGRGRLCVDFMLDVVGGDIFQELTRNNIDKPLCILVDDVAYSAPNIQTRIGQQGTITGDFSREKVNYLVQTMQAGALPARLKDTPISERTIGSSLGETNKHKAFVAGVAGVIVVALLMIGYYLINGAIANVALLMNIVLVLAAMAMLGARFTLAGIAGVILTIGMTVDANVLIFERMREEKARGSSLRMVIKNGYDKAFSTIIDANVTTLLICVIIYYVGSEEIKGFGLTLGWGIVMSLFTALFVTRTVFSLLVKYHLISDIKMLQLIGVPKINWYAKRKFFVPISLIIVAGGMSLLLTRSRKDVLDVEFLGGVNAELELTQAGMTDVDLTEQLELVGQAISATGERLVQATVEPVVTEPGLFRVMVPEVSAARLAALLTEPLEDAELLQRGGVDAHGRPNEISVRVQEGVTAEQLRDFVHGWSDDGVLAGQNIGRASVGAVIEPGGESEKGLVWNVTTTETNKGLVQHALERALGENLKRQSRISYTFRGNDDRPYPITNRRLEAVVPNLPAEATRDVTDYYEGAALRFDQLDPPQTIPDLTKRLRNMRLQPDYQDLPWREFEVIGLIPAGQAGGEATYSSVVIVVADRHYPYTEDPDRWFTELAQKELQLATATFDTEQTLRKVSQFKPQIAAQSQTRASLALLLSWAMIIAYLWLRFGRAMYGIAGVCALVHDVLIALAFVGFSGWLGGTQHPIGQALLIDDFKINMTIVAAFLTIIGYSINDTIVIFDRIRETRGRLGMVTPEVINQSINQCIARTLLTSFTTFVVLLVMYIFGGGSIRGFNYCMMIGVITGTYSSIAVAAPLLTLQFQRRRPKAAAA